jgi:hypothetical protein
VSDEIEPQPVDPPSEEPDGVRGSHPAPPARGSMLLFGLAFTFLLAAGGGLLFSVRGFLDSLTPLWVSIACSGAAVVLAVAALVVPRRR